MGSHFSEILTTKDGEKRLLLRNSRFIESGKGVGKASSTANNFSGDHRIDLKLAEVLNVSSHSSTVAFLAWCDPIFVKTLVIENGKKGLF